MAQNLPIQPRLADELDNTAVSTRPKPTYFGGSAAITHRHRFGMRIPVRNKDDDPKN